MKHIRGNEVCRRKEKEGGNEEKKKRKQTLIIIDWIEWSGSGMVVLGMGGISEERKWGTGIIKCEREQVKWGREGS